MAENDKYWEQLEDAERRLNEARRRGDTQAEADAGIFLGNSHALLQQMAEAITAFEQALPLFRETHSSAEVSKVLLQLGSFFSQAERFHQALPVLKEALALAREAGDGHSVLECLRRLGFVSTEAGHFQEAVSYHQEALIILQTNGDTEAEMHELGNLGGAYAKLDMPREALACHERALSLARAMDDRESQALQLGNLGYTYTETLGQPEKGLHYFEQALTLFREQHDQQNEAKTLGNMGGALWKAHRSQEALQAFEQARIIATMLGDRGLLGSISSKVGIIYQALGQPEKSLQEHQRALLLEQGRGDRQAEGTHLNSLGLLQREGGNPEEALHLHRKALALARERNDQLEEARQMGNIAGALMALGMREESFLQNTHALAMFQELGDMLGEARSYVNMGTAYVSMGVIDTNTGVAYAVQGNKGKVLAYWRLGQLLLQPINLAEAEAVQQKMDALSHMTNEKTFQRWWRASEGYLRWLSFQRCWITKEASVAKSRNADLIEYARESNDDAPASLGATLKQRAWQQGDRALQEKRWQDAQASYHEALRLARTQEHMKAQALLLGCLGFCYAAGKSFPEGIACFQQALSCFRSLGETRNELKTQLNLSTLFLETDALAEAHVHLGEALDLSETLEDHLFESVTLRKMGETYRRGDEISDAKRFLSYALEAARLQENQQEEGSVLTTLGVVCLELGHTKKAIEYFQQAQTLSHHLGERPSEGEQQCLLAIAYAILGRFDQSRKCFHEAQETFQDTIYKGQANMYISLTYFFQENQPFFLAHVKGVLDLVSREHEACKRVNQLIHQLTQE